MSLAIDEGTTLRIYGILATNREVLLEALDGMMEAEDGKPLGVNPSNVPYLHINLSDCGNSRSYATRADVPAESVPCKCGEVEYEHWFIRYEDAPVSEREV